ncbi:MAG: YfhO family protein [Leptolyngbya sp. Prado105]|jgi:hypothetical protein|nr:YfhO family protein [Leptolyngbya sp. Prado105]
MLTKQFKPIYPLHLVMIAAIAFLVMLPMLLYGIYDAHDLPAFHLRWAKQFSDQFWAGELYPRWLLNLNGGLGSPTFFFYSPIPYYFTSLMRPLVWIADPLGWHQLSLGALLGLVASGITAYLWLRCLVSPKAALIAAVFYVIAPYHLAVDLYVRFAYAEFWSFVWLPVILYFTHKLAAGQKKAGIGFAIAQALLIMTHLPTFLIFSPMPFLYLLWYGKHRAKITIAFGIAFILAVGLAAIYWLPAMTTKDFVILKADPNQYEFYDYTTNFLFSEMIREPFNGVIAFVEISSILTVELAAVAFLIANRVSLTRHSSLFWIAIAIFSGWMCLPQSNFVWQLLPPLQIIELPWRFNTILTLATTALIALASAGMQPVRLDLKTIFSRAVVLTFGAGLAFVALLPVRELLLTWTPAYKVLLIVSVSLSTIVVAFLLYRMRFINSRLVAAGLLLTIVLLLSSSIVMKRSLYPVLNLESELEIQRDAILHRPKWVSASLYTTDGLRQLIDETFRSAVTIEAQDQVKATTWEPRNLTLQTELETEQWLTLKQFYYPAWTAHTEQTALSIRPSPEGLLQIQIPAGKQSVAIHLAILAQEKLGMYLSLGSGSLLLAWLVLSSKPIQRFVLSKRSGMNFSSSPSVK